MMLRFPFVLLSLCLFPLPSRSDTPESFDTKPVQLLLEHSGSARFETISGEFVGCVLTYTRIDRDICERSATGVTEIVELFDFSKFDPRSVTARAVDQDGLPSYAVRFDIQDREKKHYSEVKQAYDAYAQSFRDEQGALTGPMTWEPFFSDYDVQSLPAFRKTLSCDGFEGLLVSSLNFHLFLESESAEEVQELFEGLIASCQ